MYGPNQDRIKHSDSNGRVTIYIGSMYEEVTKGGMTYYIHRLGDIGQMVSTGAHTTATVNYEYTHRDQLGSILHRKNIK